MPKGKAGHERQHEGTRFSGIGHPSPDGACWLLQVLLDSSDLFIPDSAVLARGPVLSRSDSHSRAERKI